ncbi:MAG: NADH-quinone oxidoreductase subunit NuoE [Bacteroidales bacterium]|nr:NADH-quinone oxidoreductase subunit NuoE [Bacteroidales bacterium]MBN2749211.1 NADH-quinone oxidoreductase subunit NuoE [Bacteroidales bacterium]
MRSRIESLLENYTHSKRDSLIPILQQIQDDLGYLSEEAVVLVGKHLSMPTSQIYGLATFYNQFRFEPKGKYHVQVCHGTACHVLGAQSILSLLEKMLKIKEGQTSRDGQFSLQVMSCIGACAHAPAIAINGKFYGKLTQERLKEVIEELRQQ